MHKKKLVTTTTYAGSVAPVDLVITVLGALLSTAGFVGAFVYAAPVVGASADGAALVGDTMLSNQLLFSQKIFYFHVPVAIASFFLLSVMAYYSVRFLMTHKPAYDRRARISAEVSFIFVICTMISGDLWTRFEWGVWWTWEPRLTTYLILMLLIIAYFVIRNALDDPERRSAVASVFGIIIFVDVPLCFFITRLIPSSFHPVIFRTDSGLSPDMLVPFLFSLFGILFLAFGLYRLRLLETELNRRVERIKECL